VKSPECENWMPMTAETTETATPTDREKALAAAEEIKSWGGFTEERVADIILKHMREEQNNEQVCLGQCNRCGAVCLSQASPTNQ
jgi:hypothetical protein